ncbi:hypothetical protein JXA32_16370 [Candidatus Sumerlaeota bacterium]|nr:hypothetical protein [Candidatus Sumerlaeota bacterium]
MPLQLNLFSYPARAPQVAVFGDADYAVVWQGTLDGRERIMMRRFQNGAWSAEQPVDSGREGQHLSPHAAADDSGALHLGWVLRTADPRAGDVVCYARRSAQGDWRYEEWPLADGTLCDTLSLLPCGGKARIALHAVSAETSDILLIDIPVSAARPAEMQYLSPDSGPEIFNLYPMLFKQAPAEVMWYRSSAQGFDLIGASQLGSGEWELLGAEELLPAINASRLPLIRESENGEPIAVWHEPLDGVDRIWLVLGGSASGPVIIDDLARQNNRVPDAAVAPSSEIAVAWVGETQQGNTIQYKILDSNLSVSGRVDSAAPNSAKPVAAFAPGGRLLLAWHTNDTQDAGDIYFEIIPR